MYHFEKKKNRPPSGLSFTETLAWYWKNDRGSMIAFLLIIILMAAGIIYLALNGGLH